MTFGFSDLAFIGAVGVPGLPVWNAFNDLQASLAGTPTNPNGRWTYGRKTTGLVFSNITGLNASGWFGTAPFDTPNFLVGGGSIINSHTPISSTDFSVLRWTAPSNMTISIDLRVTKTTTGGDGIIHTVRHNSTVLNTSAVIQGPSGAHEYLNSSLSVSTGHTIDFEGARNATNDFDQYTLNRVIITQLS